MSKRVFSDYHQSGNESMITTESPLDNDDLLCLVLNFVYGAQLLCEPSLELRRVSHRFRDAMDQHVLAIYNTKSLGVSGALLARLSGLRHLSFGMCWAEHSNHKATLSTLLDLHQGRATSLWIDGRMDLCYRLQHFTALRSLQLSHCACNQYQSSSFNNEGLRSLSTLTSLSLMGTPVSAGALKNKPLLHTLILVGNRNIIPMRTLTRLTQLRTLDIDYIGGVDIRQLSQLTRLVVGSGGGSITDMDMTDILTLTQLQSLSICLPCKSTGASSILREMARQLTQLTDLSLMGKLTINVQDLVLFTSLRSLGLKKLHPLTRDIKSRRSRLELPDGRIIQLYGC